MNRWQPFFLFSSFSSFSHWHRYWIMSNDGATTPMDVIFWQLAILNAANQRSEAIELNICTSNPFSDVKRQISFQTNWFATHFVRTINVNSEFRIAGLLPPSCTTAANENVASVEIRYTWLSKLYDMLCTMVAKSENKCKWKRDNRNAASAMSRNYLSKRN